MTTRLGGAVLLAALTAALAGCGGGDDGGGSSASAARPCTGTIGVMAPVTGDAAMQGLEQVHFARLAVDRYNRCLLYTSPSPRDGLLSRMPSSA